MDLFHLVWQAFLLSEAAQRVYRIDYLEVKLEFALPQLSIIESKSWQEFFVCSPSQKVPPDNGHSQEPAQGEYLNMAQQWSNLDPENESWFKPTTLVAWLSVSLILSLVIGMIVLRIKKRRRRGEKRGTSVAKTSSSSHQRLTGVATTTAKFTTTTTEKSCSTRDKAKTKSPLKARKVAFEVTLP